MLGNFGVEKKAHTQIIGPDIQGAGRVRAVTDCYNCVLDDVIGAVKLLGLNADLERRIGDECRAYMDQAYPERLVPSIYITEVHRIVKRLSGLAMPFKELRETCNSFGIRIAGRVRERAAALPEAERFRLLALWSIAGNHLDFRTVGAGYGFTDDEIEGMLQEKVDLGLQVDRIADMHEILRAGPSVLFIPDNVGEIAFDRLLMEELKRYGCAIACPYRGGPITSDAVESDFDAVGIREVADEVFCAGPDTLGISWEEMTPELASALQSAEVVLAKGQANYYVTHEYLDRIPGRVLNLLTTKCDPVSKTLGRDGKVNVAAIQK